MSEATLEDNRTMSYRYAPRFATNATTTAGEEELPVFAAARSEALLDARPTLARLAVRLPESPSHKDFWCLLLLPPNELVQFPDLEASEEQLGRPGDATATETPWPEFWTEIETHIRTAWGTSPHAHHLPETSKPGEALKSDFLAPPARTELGKRLREIRRRIVASGEPLLDWDDFDREMRERRGEREPEDEA